MNSSPWLSAEPLKIANLLLTSYEKTYNEPLLPCCDKFLSNIDKGKKLFSFKNPVIAHNKAIDPCLTYANSTALLLWSRHWYDMIGLPSRLTAPEEKQKERKEILDLASKNNSIRSYQGIRINSKGELFAIKNVSIWTIRDNTNNIYGQAATFNEWEKL